MSSGEVNAASGDPSTSSLDERFLSGDDSAAPEATANDAEEADDTSRSPAYLPLTASNLEEASNMRPENHPVVSSGNHMLAILLPPVASSRQLWHFAIKCRLAKCSGLFDLGELLLFAIQTIPARLSSFLRTFTSFTMPIRGTDLSVPDSADRLRDLLPLPLPAMEKYSRWREYESNILRGRASRGQSQRLQKFVNVACIDLWNFLVVFGLNFEYCGRLSTGNWSHNSVPTEP